MEYSDVYDVDFVSFLRQQLETAGMLCILSAILPSYIIQVVNYEYACEMDMKCIGRVTVQSEDAEMPNTLTISLATTHEPVIL